MVRWLVLAALGEWLLLRTITRAAIHVPKSPLIITLYGVVNQVGQFTAVLAALLALVLLLWIAWEIRRALWLPLGLVGLAGLSLLFLFLVPPVWLALAYQLLALAAVLLLSTARQETRARTGLAGAAARFFPAAALAAGLAVQLLPNLYSLLNLPGPPPLTGRLFNLGELLVAASVFSWWWGYGRVRSWQPWVLAALPAFLFTASFLRDPAMTGILTIWSTGLTLFLPWPIYAVALWLAGVTVLANWRQRPQLVNAILLLLAAGYAPQLSSQLFAALIALWLLNRPALSVPAPTAPRRRNLSPAPPLFERPV